LPWPSVYFGIGLQGSRPQEHNIIKYVCCDKCDFILKRNRKYLTSFGKVAYEVEMLIGKSKVNHNYENKAIDCVEAPDNDFTAEEKVVSNDCICMAGVVMQTRKVVSTISSPVFPMPAS
jgi:hypothetical protein